MFVSAVIRLSYALDGIGIDRGIVHFAINLLVT